MNKSKNEIVERMTKKIVELPTVELRGQALMIMAAYEAGIEAGRERERLRIEKEELEGDEENIKQAV